MSRLLRTLLFLFSPDRIFKADKCCRTDIVIKSFNLQQIVTVCCCAHKAKSKRSKYTGQGGTHSIVDTFSNSSWRKSSLGMLLPRGLRYGLQIRNKAKVYNPEYNFKAFTYEHCSSLCTNQESDTCPGEKNNKAKKQKICFHIKEMTDLLLRWVS